MKNIWKWIVFGLAVFLVSFLVALPLFAGTWMPSMRTVLRYDMMHDGMMGLGFGGISWIGMLFRSVLPTLFVVGGIALVYLLVKSAGPKAVAPVPTTPCYSCEKPLNPDWVACPYCGKKKKKTKK